MAGKGKFGEFVEGQARGALEGLADLFTMPKVKQAMVDDAIQNPEVLDSFGVAPEDMGDIVVDVDSAFDAIFDSPRLDLEDLGDDVLDEIISFAEKGAIPEGQIAKSMIDSLFDSGLEEKEARFFMDASLKELYHEGSVSMQKNQKPYVSVDSRAKEYRVLDSSGRVDKTFSDINSASSYFNKNYDKLMKR